MAQDRRLDSRKALIALMGTPVFVSSFSLSPSEYSATAQLEEDGLYLVSSSGGATVVVDTNATLTNIGAIQAAGITLTAGVPYRVFLRDTYRYIKVANTDASLPDPVYINVFKLS